MADILPGNGAGLFLQPRSPYEANKSRDYYQVRPTGVPRMNLCGLLVRDDSTGRMSFLSPNQQWPSTAGQNTSVDEVQPRTDKNHLSSSSQSSCKDNKHLPVISYGLDAAIETIFAACKSLAKFSTTSVQYFKCDVYKFECLNETDRQT